jgi:hypothetical protein
MSYEPLPSRLENIAHRITRGLEVGVSSNKWQDRVKLHFTQNETGSEFLVTYEVIAPVASNRSFYPQNKILLIRIQTDLQQNPPITLQRTSTVLYKSSEGEDEFMYFGIDEPSFNILIRTVCSDMTNWCPRGLRQTA